jgi:hypothetical protein
MNDETKKLEAFFQRLVEEQLALRKQTLTEQDFKDAAISQGFTVEQYDRMQQAGRNHFVTGTNFLTLGDFKNALAELEIAASYRPFDAGVLSKIAEVYQRSWLEHKNAAHRKKAVEYARQTLKISPADTIAVKIISNHYSLGDEAQSKGRRPNGSLIQVAILLPILLPLAIFIISRVIDSYLANTQIVTLSDAQLTSMPLFAFKGWNRQWGFLNATGQKVIAPQYPRVWLINERGKGFYGQFAIVTATTGDGLNQFGFINKRGLFTSLLSADSINTARIDALPDGGIKIVVEGKFGDTRIIRVHPGGSYTQWIEPNIDKIRFDYIGKFGEHPLATVSLNGKYGLLKRNGELATDLKYDYIDTVFTNGLVVAAINGKYGYLDTTGAVAVELKYDYAERFDAGNLGRVRVGNLRGAVDVKGNTVIPHAYANLYEFSEGLAAFRKVSNGKWGVIDSTGKVIVPPTYDFIYRTDGGFSKVGVGNRTSVKDGSLTPSGGKWGFIDRNGKVVVPPIYDNVYWNSQEKDFFKAELGGKYGLLDQTGKVILEPRLSAIGKFNEGIAAAAIGGTRNKQGYLVGGKWGAIDANGKTIVNFIYDLVGNCSDGAMFVNIGGTTEGNEVRGGNWGFVDRNGNPISELKFKSVRQFSEGLAWVFDGENWGAIDKTGQFYIDAKYNQVFRDFENGVAIVKNSAHKTCLLSRSGKVLAEFYE